ncbi:hypothetical protein [Sphingomonas immobilis]|uniref:Uncharacterized protein n=1 Tax=Sphingomonas immobilis TaxID=3063997 RepID=A0ABT9A554_9SPHN|nr:hypothetical protein [Sphingomonas sp. CA1-15]MDO7844355.1 hypothetical protein [Sphingomonas sp. CA1-15]
MVFDLRGALLKKQEFETARLADFQFRQRVRTMRLLAAALAIEEDGLVRDVVREQDAAILVSLAERLTMPLADVSAAFAQCQSEARGQLIAELGDPTPYRLA